MRTSLLVLVFLVHTVQSYRYERDEVVKVLNSARSEIAEKAQIANMNKLEYNPDLEEKIHMELIFNSGCSTRVIDKDTIKIYKNFKLEDMKDEQSIVEFLGAPGMTEMAYVKNLCLKAGRKMHNFAFKKTLVVFNTLKLRSTAAGLVFESSAFGFKYLGFYERYQKLTNLYNFTDITINKNKIIELKRCHSIRDFIVFFVPETLQKSMDHLEASASGRRPTSDGLCALGKSYARKVVDSSRPWIVMKDPPPIAVRMKTEEEIKLEKWINEFYWNRINKPIGEKKIVIRKYLEL